MFCQFLLEHNDLFTKRHHDFVRGCQILELQIANKSIRNSDERDRNFAIIDGLIEAHAARKCDSLFGAEVSKTTWVEVQPDKVIGIVWADGIPHRNIRRIDSAFRNLDIAESSISIGGSLAVIPGQDLVVPLHLNQKANGNCVVCLIDIDRRYGKI